MRQGVIGPKLPAPYQEPRLSAHGCLWGEEEGVKSLLEAS